MTPKSLIEPARHAGTALLRSQTDARLVDLTREGNERAFEAIVQRYRRPLLRYCSRLLSPSRAEDAVQQAFLSAHRAIHAGDADLNLRPWLYRIAHNMSLNLLRQNGFDHEQVSEDIDGVETPPQAFERGEQLRTVVAAVRELPERQRSAIVLQALEGRSYDEIADELGVSDGAVRQLLNRARNTLREAAAALTPAGLLTRIAANGGEATVAERVAQVVAGAGGSALVAKAGAALVIAGAVAGGAATGGLPGQGSHHHRDGGRGSAAVAQAPASAAGSSSAPKAHRSDVVLTTRGNNGAAPTFGGGRQNTSRHGSSQGSGPNASGRGSDGGSGSSGSGSGSSGGSDHHGGGSGSGNDTSGSGSGSGSDHSGSGSSGDSSDHSGSGDSSTTPTDDKSPNSGSGSGSDSSGSDDTAVPPTTTTTPVETHSGHSGGSDKSSDDSPEPPDDGSPSGSGTSGSSH
jgi:RNA polymerase sigma factor (sigma-70 family)